MKVSEWAERRGHWRSEYMPWLGDILDEAANLDTHTIVIEGDRGSGKSTALAIIALWAAERQAEPVLYVEPTESMASLTRKRFGAEPLISVAHHAPAVFAQRPRRVSLIDSIERAPAMGAEDDLISLVRKRSLTFEHPLFVVCGEPGIGRRFMGNRRARTWSDGKWRAAGFVEFRLPS